jgi:hypothetical protein
MELAAAAGEEPSAHQPGITAVTQTTASLTDTERRRTTLTIPYPGM